MGYMGNDFEYQINQYFSNLESHAETIGIIVAVVMLAAVLILLAHWIMRSIALTHLGNRRGIKAPWLVWLPIVGCWTIGALADDYDARNGIKRRFRVILLVCSILAAAAYSFASTEGLSSMLDLSFEMEYGADADIIEDVVELFIKVYSAIIVYSLIMMIQYVCTYICLYKVYESTMPRHAVLCFILSLLVPLAEPICLLIAMNKGYPDDTPAQPALCEAAPEAIGWYEA